jgi:hypothetical protein
LTKAKFVFEVLEVVKVQITVSFEEEAAEVR